MALDQLTVVIPTRQRPRYVERLLRYLAAAGHRSRVLIADSSADGQAVTLEAVARAADHFACAYHAFPPAISLFRKCHEAMLLVETPLVVLLADDDFIVPSTLASAAARLADDPSIALAHGTAMRIALDHGPDVEPMSTIRSRSRRHLVAEHASAVDRVAHYLRHYASIYYSVMRRERATTNFELLSRLNQDYDFGQIMAGCLCLADGKAVAVEGLYYVVMDTAIGASRHQTALIPGWRRLVTEPDFSARYAQWKGLVLDALARSCPRDAAERELDDAFVDYLVERVHTTPGGELERLRRVAREARDASVRLGAIALKGARSIVDDPASVRDLRSPREALSRWARALDPMSIDSLSEGRDATAIRQVLASLEGYAG